MASARLNDGRGRAALLLAALLLALACLAPRTGLAATSRDWRWPTDSESYGYGYPNYSSGSFHGGTDISVPTGTPVYATCDMEVVYTKVLTGSYGKHIVLVATVEGELTYFWYAHLSEFAVSGGQEVSAGELIGYSGSTGNSTGPHLHYEVRDSTNGHSAAHCLDPTNYMPGSSYEYELNNAPIPPDPHLPDYNYGSAITLPEGNGEYVVASALDPRYVLDVYCGSKDHGANVQIYGYNCTAAQRWWFTGNGDGTYTITNVGSECALDVGDASTRDGANVQQYPPNGSDAQKWWVEDCGDGTYALKAVHSWGFLDVEGAVAQNDTNAQQWRGNGSAAQKWLISKCCATLAVLPEGDGEYTVASALDPRYMLDVYAGSVEQGANVQMYEANGTVAQRWRFARNGDGTYTIDNVGSGCALDVDDASRLNDANVKQWAHNGTAAQRWWVEDCGDGTYYVRSVNSGRSLDIPGGAIGNGANVQQYHVNGSNAQRWLISKRIGNLSALPRGDGTYRVALAADTRYVLDVASGSTENGANVQLYEGNGSDAQLFEFSLNDDGSYTIRNKKSGKALDVAERSRLDGANVHQWEDGKGLNQKWWMEDYGDASYCIKSVNSGKCLDVRNGVFESDTSIQQHRSNGTDAQRWRLLPADSAAPTISEAHVTDVSEKGYTVTCTVTDDTGVEKVVFPTWTVAGGQDDLAPGWEDGGSALGTRDGDRWSFRVLASDHNGESGQYVTHVYTWDAAGNSASLALPVVEVPTSSQNDGWVDFPGGKKGYHRGGQLVTGWMDLNGAKYWFGEDGAMATGWTDVTDSSGKTFHYYFNPASGNLVRGTWFEIDGYKYYFRPSGNVAHGWATISDNGVDKKYWFDDDYRMVTGWRDIDTGNGYAAHYYFRPAGSMATGWATIDGQKYWFRPSGNMATGFTTVDDAYKRYFDQSGHMLVGWQVIDGKTFYFRASGAMQTGIATIDGREYEFTSSGTLSAQSDKEDADAAAQGIEVVDEDLAA